ncbi:MAG: YkgJ family cysteine cluster protein [Candidatus Hermodarchaeota archaeon]
MNELYYTCQKCGTCCHEIEYKKRIPLYPDEADELIEIAKKNGIKFRIIEDLVFPDILNKKILVLTYKIRLDNETHGCPFYDLERGCTVHETKPLACKAYPLALKQVDAFNFQISVDPLCNFVDRYYDSLKKADFAKIKEVFKNEYPNAQEHLKKNKNLMLKIKKLEYKNKIRISREILLKDFNKYLKEWEREEITTN